MVTLGHSTGVPEVSGGFWVIKRGPRGFQKRSRGVTEGFKGFHGRFKGYQRWLEGFRGFIGEWICPLTWPNHFDSPCDRGNNQPNTDEG